MKIGKLNYHSGILHALFCCDESVFHFLGNLISGKISHMDGADDWDVHISLSVDSVVRHISAAAAVDSGLS